MIAILCKEIVKTLKIDRFVETGTDKGETVAEVARWFAEIDPDFGQIAGTLRGGWRAYHTREELSFPLFESSRPSRYQIHSVDSERHSFEAARKRFESNCNIHLHHGSSEQFLENLPEGEGNRTLFFLDAHWGKYWPLQDELRAICRLERYLVVIDDFFVPGKSDPSFPHGPFGFDVYNKTILNWAYVKDLFAGREPQIFYPHSPSRDQRGWVLLARGYSAEELRFLRSLGLFEMASDDPRHAAQISPPWRSRLDGRNLLKRFIPVAWLRAFHRAAEKMLSRKFFFSLLLVLLFGLSNLFCFFFFEFLGRGFPGAERFSLLKIFGPPLAIVATALFCLWIEWRHFGWENSALKRLLVRPTPTAKTDIFYFLLSLSGLRPLFALLFSCGAGFAVSRWLTSTFSVSLLAGHGFFVSLAAAVLVNTFLFYWTHRIMHTLLLWDIHKVHHSAEELNLLTPHRNHPLDFTVSMVMSTFPLAVLGLSFEVLVCYSFLNAVYQQMVHSNMRWRPDWLNHILITPQAHRVHHSREKRHFSKNYGVLTLWDWLFGTWYFPRPEDFSIGLEDESRECGVEGEAPTALLLEGATRAPRDEALHNTGKPFREMWRVYQQWVAHLPKKLKREELTVLEEGKKI